MKKIKVRLLITWFCGGLVFMPLNVLPAAPTSRTAASSHECKPLPDATIKQVLRNAERKHLATIKNYELAEVGLDKSIKNLARVESHKNLMLKKRKEISVLYSKAITRARNDSKSYRIKRDKRSAIVARQSWLESMSIGRKKWEVDVQVRKAIASVVGAKSVFNASKKSLALALKKRNVARAHLLKLISCYREGRSDFRYYLCQEFPSLCWDDEEDTSR